MIQGSGPTFALVIEFSKRIYLFSDYFTESLKKVIFSKMNFLRFIFLTFVGIIILMNVSRMVSCRRLDKRAVFNEERADYTQPEYDGNAGYEYYDDRQYESPPVDCDPAECARRANEETNSDLTSDDLTVEWKCEEVEDERYKVNNNDSINNQFNNNDNVNNRFNNSDNVNNQFNNNGNVNNHGGKNNFYEPETYEICKTNGCNRTARSVLSNMDSNVDPCDNFYLFSCGNFLKNSNIRENVKLDSSKLTSIEFTRRIKEIVEAEIEPNQIKSLQLPKILYRSCMNEKLIGDQELRALLNHLGGWPVLMDNEWKDDNFDWKKVIQKHREVGLIVFYLMDFGIQSDQKSNDNNFIVLRVPNFNIGMDRLLNGRNDAVVNAYLEYMTDVAVILGANREQAARDMEQALELEIELANLSLQQKNEPWNTMKLRELIETYPSISWLDGINNILAPITSVTENEMINVPSPSFLSKLVELLGKKPKRVLANYLRWKLVEGFAPDLNEVIQNKHFEFQAKKQGLQNIQKPARLQDCLERVLLLYPSFISLYARKYFGRDAKAAAAQIFTGIKQELEESLNRVGRMDETTRMEVLGQAKFMNAKIAYPYDILYDDQLEKYYQNLELTPENHLQNMINIHRFAANNSLETLRNSTENKVFKTFALPKSLDLKYSPEENTFNLPVAVLQDTFFEKDRPDYMNYGAIGWLIGTELTNGFNNTRKQYDENGNLENSRQPTIQEEYFEKAQCFVDQLRRMPDQKENNTLAGIGMVHTAGIKLAYQAYKQKNVIEPRLPGLENFSPEQMFWISAANDFCENNVQESPQTDDIYDSGAFRVYSSMLNMPEFAKDFKCQPGSNMNLEINKCSLW